MANSFAYGSRKDTQRLMQVYTPTRIHACLFHLWGGLTSLRHLTLNRGVHDACRAIGGMKKAN